MYELIYSKEALKQLEKLPKEISIRIINSLERCRIRPHSHLQRLVSLPYFKLRVGKYRAIVDIIEDKLYLLVMDADHRKNIYKKYK